MNADKVGSGVDAGPPESIKGAVRQQFGSVADRYATSAVHASGPDLEALVNAVPTDGARILDVGCGAGHTTLAVAARAASVVGVDLTEEMLAQARRLADEHGLQNVTFVRGDAEQLDYQDASFDLVVSRYSAHHFPHPEQALHEFARVLSPGGTFLLVDTIAPNAPAQDTLLNAIEVLRDPSHVRDHTVAGWLSMFAAAGFAGEMLQCWQVRLSFDAWVTRMQTPDVAVSAIGYLLDGAPREMRALLAVERDRSFSIPVALLRGCLSNRA
ncbi:MAG TPA: class I SAM-dependent methyltransferase [Chloroflexota bacterium]